MSANGNRCSSRSRWTCSGINWTSDKLVGRPTDFRIGNSISANGEPAHVETGNSLCAKKIISKIVISIRIRRDIIEDHLLRSDHVVNKPVVVFPCRKHVVSDEPGRRPPIVVSTERNNGTESVPTHLTLRCRDKMVNSWNRPLA